MADALALRANAPMGREGSSPSFGTNRRVAQLVARAVWDREAPGSNPGSPTLYAYKIHEKNKLEKNS